MFLPPMSPSLFISGFLLLQLAGCAMSREAQSTETMPEPAAVAAEQPPAAATEPPASAAPPAEEPDPAVAAPTPAPAIAPSPASEKPAAPAAAPAAKAAPVAAEKPAAKPPAKTAAPAPQQKTAAQPPAAPPPQEAMPAMALATLEQRLKDTNAIGLFTKLALKNQVDDLVNRVRAHHEGNGATLAQLRQAYDQLLAKVHGLLKDGDPALAGSIMASREAIWQVLTDPVKFAKL
ncbi:MAG: hypothetical protein KIT13_02770 [Burkholderiales bacterium]|nr:hypothetical protein [Burkholderiales bacterium]